MSNSGSGRTPHVQSVQRAIALLSAVAKSEFGATAQELAHTCGLTKPTAWRVLKTLEATGMVVMDRSSGRYWIGPLAVEIGSATSEATLIRLTHPLLEEASARSGETADLAIPRATGLAYVDEVTPPAVIAASWLGRPVPLHATSTGKALLAWLPEQEVDALLEQPLQRFTATTITSRAQLAVELADVRSLGYATCEGELEETLYGVSIPVLMGGGRPRAIVSLWGPRGRMGGSRLAELAAILADTMTGLHLALASHPGIEPAIDPSREPD